VEYVVIGAQGEDLLSPDLFAFSDEHEDGGGGHLVYMAAPAPLDTTVEAHHSPRVCRYSLTRSVWSGELLRAQALGHAFDFPAFLGHSKMMGEATRQVHM
jgi:hypothetical protein